MAVNQNGFNSRITSEALEERFRQVFPAQGGSELIADLYASGVIVPTIDFTSVAEGSFLPEPLQQAWDFSTGHDVCRGAPTTVINTPGFWKIDLTSAVLLAASVPQNYTVDIFDGVTANIIWQFSEITSAAILGNAIEETFIVFLRAGDSLRASTPGANNPINIWYRQVASVNGILVNPLGFSF